MDVKTEVIYDSGNAEMCFSLCKRRYIELNGRKQYIGEQERMAVCPGEFERVEEFAPELAAVFRGLWTEGVVEKWKKKQEEAEAEIVRNGI